MKIVESMRKNGAILTLFAVISTLLVLTTARLTEAPIARQQEAHVLRVLNELIPPTQHDNDLFQSCTLVESADFSAPRKVYRAFLADQPQAVALEVVAPNGYSGAIELLVAVAVTGEVLGVRTISHNETPGLGDKIELRKSDWVRSFEGLQVNSEDDPRWAVKRDGGIFDQFTGATITPRAVVQAVKRAALVAQREADNWYQLPANCMEQAP
ncbi:electron transport complex subunit RsxG [Pseudidiomarina taiwanensis]|uniref:Ion-translocating oxidoreductase complex subunit G n=1 Tax=Pseudidiomarina taiwanensis TaxID=337250 RepID=A0A432ZNT4_9GAMM|nr:electron transport complex subunit RsxG [Pseudidiomarina taiwanensis]RUO79559.1 electron transport complex subunit RsxG [Pseudidiomarina taiwanensis]